MVEAAKGGRQPALAVGWDCHVHVFDATRPVLTGHYRPGDQPLAKIEALATTIGVGHLVLVQPSVYGHDNGLLLEALRGEPGRHRGVVVLADDVGDASELRVLQRHCFTARLHARVADGLARRTYFCSRHPVSFQQRQEFSRRKRVSECLDVSIDLVDVCHAGIARREARVVFELGVPDGREHTAGELLGWRAD